MNWSPNMNPGQQPAPNAAQPTHGAPQPSYGNGQPQGGGYAGPGAGQGYGGAPAGSPPPVRFGVPNLNGEREPELPFGDHILEATGRVEFVGQKNDLLIVEFVVKQTNNPNVPLETKGVWKRKLTGTHPATDQMVTDAIGRLVVPLSGRKKDATDGPTALNLIAEFYNRRTLDGQSIAGKRVGATCTQSKKADRNGDYHTDSIFHTL
jgi:hypothetical protein